MEGYLDRLSYCRRHLPSVLSQVKVHIHVPTTVVIAAFSPCGPINNHRYEVFTTAVLPDINACLSCNICEVGMKGSDKLINRIPCRLRRKPSQGPNGLIACFPL